jgi:hypothetical protein
MSDPRIVGPLSAIAVPLGDAAQQFRASSPFQQSVGLACFGAITLGFCGEAAVLLGPSLAAIRAHARAYGSENPPWDRCAPAIR